MYNELIQELITIYNLLLNEDTDEAMEILSEIITTLELKEEMES